MSPDASFEELIRRVGSGGEQAAAWLVWDFEPVIRRVLRARLRNAGSRREFDSIDICQSVLATFFVRVAAGQYDLKEPDDQLYFPELLDQTHPSFGASAPNQRSVITFFRV